MFYACRNPQPRTLCVSDRAISLMSIKLYSLGLNAPGARWEGGEGRPVRPVLYYTAWYNNIIIIICLQLFVGIIDNPHDSLFIYGPNGDWDYFYDINYIPVFEPTFSSTELEEQANEICGNNQLCIFDIAATGDIDIGSSTVESVHEHERLMKQFVQSNCDS